MESTSILQIVPGFKPSTNGLGDFSHLLGSALWKTHGIRSHYLIYRQPKQPFNATEIAPNTISYCAEPTPAVCEEALHSLLKAQHFRCALLHYGPYSYSYTGNPAAFSAVMARLAQRLDLLTFFHETCANGPPWKRAFWTRREQQQSLGLLRQASKARFSSTLEYVSYLDGNGYRPIRLPIFSNMGEPEIILPLAQRKRQIAVFGQLNTRLKVYRQRKTLEDLCGWLRIETIVDVGSGSDPSIPETIAGIPVRKVGRLEEDEVSALLSDCIAGAIRYSPYLWAKSGVIAAYAAHATLPVLFPGNERRSGEIDVSYIEVQDLGKLRTADGTIPDATLEELAGRAHRYYTANQSLVHCAATIASQILG